MAYLDGVTAVMVELGQKPNWREHYYPVAAELLQVSRRTLQRMLNRKELPALKVGGQWRIHEKRLAQWLEGLHDL